MAKTVIPAGHVTVTYTIPTELKAAIVALAKWKGTSAAAEVRIALQAHVDAQQQVRTMLAGGELESGKPEDKTYAELLDAEFTAAALLADQIESGHRLLEPHEVSSDFTAKITNLTEDADPGDEDAPRLAAAPLTAAFNPPPVPATCPHRVPAGAYCRACQKEAAA